jgi:hypothetical protein
LNRGWVGPRAGLDVLEKKKSLARTGLRAPDRPAHCSYILEDSDIIFVVTAKANAISLQAWTGLSRPFGSRRLRLPEFLDARNKKVVRLSALRTGRLYSSGDIPLY